MNMQISYAIEIFIQANSQHPALMYIAKIGTNNFDDMQKYSGNIWRSTWILYHLVCDGVEMYRAKIHYPWTQQPPFKHGVR